MGKGVVMVVKQGGGVLLREQLRVTIMIMQLLRLFWDAAVLCSATELLQTTFRIMLISETLC